METNVILYFDNDDDFATFALDPMTVCSKLDSEGNESLYMRHNFSKMYQDALSCGKKFCVRDLKSHVNKDGLLGTQWATYRIPQENIEKYWGDEYIDDFCETHPIS